jgi:ankyrin repeat protein
MNNSKNLKGFYRRYSNNTSIVSMGDSSCSNQLKSSSTSLLHLAKQRRFDKIEEYLSVSPPSKISAWIDAGSFPNAVSMGLQAFKGETILHLIMVYQPTVEVVDLLISAMIKKDPRVVPEAVTDIQGRTPLTVAVIYNCDVSVIRRLLNGVTTIVPAVTKDSWQRLPLHWACTHESIFVKGTWSIKCTAKAKESDNMVRIIEALLKAYSYAAVVQDVAGMTPLDIVVNNRSDPYVQQIIRMAWESFQPKEDKSKACTADNTESTDVPFEEFDTDFFDDDFDDVSSIGTGGVSRARNRRSKSRNYSRKRYPFETAHV